MTCLGERNDTFRVHVKRGPCIPTWKDEPVIFHSESPTAISVCCLTTKMLGIDHFVDLMQAFLSLTSETISGEPGIPPKHITGSRHETS